MLLNLTNHPYQTWKPAQQNAAHEQFGEVIDLMFPSVDPTAKPSIINTLAEQEAKKIIDEYKDKENVHILLMGEFSFTYVMQYLLYGIFPLYVTTKYDSSDYEFVSFRRILKPKAIIKKKVSQTNSEFDFNAVYYQINKHKSALLGIGGFLIIGAIFIFLFYQYNGVSRFWTNTLDPFLGLITATFSILIFAHQRVTKWKASLQHRFTVHYCYQGLVYASFYHGFVVGKDDIRNQAQSLGGSLFGENLKLTTNNSLIENGVITLDDDKKRNYYNHWEYFMRINEAPKFLTNKKLYYQNKPYHYEHPYILYTVDHIRDDPNPIEGHIFNLAKQTDYCKIDGADRDWPHDLHSKQLEKFKYTDSEYIHSVINYPKIKSDEESKKPTCLYQQKS